MCGKKKGSLKNIIIVITGIAHMVTIFTGMVTIAINLKIIKPWPQYTISCPDASISNQALTFEFPRVITRINVTFFIDSYQSTTISIFLDNTPLYKEFSLAKGRNICNITLTLEAKTKMTQHKLRFGEKTYKFLLLRCPWTHVVSLVPGSWISEKDTLNIEVRVENYGIPANFTVFCEIYRILNIDDLPEVKMIYQDKIYMAYYLIILVGEL